MKKKIVYQAYLGERNETLQHSERLTLAEAQDQLGADRYEEKGANEIWAYYDEKPIKKYEVIEDNGGGLYLIVFGDDGNVEFMADGYEYRADTNGLMDDIQSLKDGADPIADGWGWGLMDSDRPENPQEMYESNFTTESRLNGGWAIVADNDGIYPEAMGGSAMRSFGIEVD